MLINQEIKILKSKAIFHDVEEPLLQILAFSSELRDFGNQENIFEHSETKDCAILIITGSIQETNLMNKSNQSKDYGPGSMIGELNMIAKIKPKNHFIITQPTTVKLYSHELFIRISSEFPNFAHAIQKKLTQHLDRSIDELNELKSSFTG